MIDTTNEFENGELIYTITMKFRETGNNQNVNQDALFTAKLQIDTIGIYLYNNCIRTSKDTAIDYSNAAESGLFYTANNQYGEEEKRIYYFRKVLVNSKNN